MEPGVNICGTHVIVFKIIGVFPDKPGISGTEYGERGFLEERFEVFRTSEPAGHFPEEDRSRTGSRRFLHAVKIEAVAEYPSGVVADRILQTAGKSAPDGQQFFQGKTLQGGILFQYLVEIIDIRLQMPVVMQMHGLFIDERLQSVVSVWQRCVDKRIVTVQ